MKKNLGKALQLILGIVLFTLIISYGNPQGLTKITDTNLNYILLSFLATGILVSLAAYRWKLIVKTMGGEGKYIDYLYFLLLGRALGNITPRDTTDIAVRSASLKFTHAFPLKKGIYSIMVDKFFDLIIFACMLGPAVLFLFNIISLNIAMITSLGIILLSGITLYFYQHKAFRILLNAYNFIILILSKIPWVKKYASKKELLDPAEIKDTVISYMYAITILKFLFNAYSKFVILLAIGVNISFLPILLGTTISQLASIVSITPGALGVLEVGWYAILYLLKIGATEITLFLVLQRVVTFLSIILLTFIVHIIRVMKD